jgi:hypothetical protein
MRTTYLAEPQVRLQGEVVDYWFRDVIPLRSHLPWYKLSERFDNFVCTYTPLKFFASNIEFLAYKSDI